MPKSKVWRTIIVLGGFALLIALFYAEEDWRGKRAWEKCKAELEAKGEVLDWDEYIPPPVLDEQNFFKAPKMAEWFVKPARYDGTNELASRMSDPRTGSVTGETNSIATEDEARSYLTWSGQFELDFDLIREALKRPDARMDGDYSNPFEMPIPNFVNIRIVAQTLAQRAHCFLLLGQPEKALDELTLLNDSRHMLEGAPTGKPMTLVAAMIDVAVTGLYANTIADGLHLRAWQEPQLHTLQQQLKNINLLPLVVDGFRMERASSCCMIEDLLRSNDNLWQKTKSGRIPLAPHGWLYQNLVWIAKLNQAPVEFIDCTNQIISPKDWTMRDAPNRR